MGAPPLRQRADSMAGEQLGAAQVARLALRWLCQLLRMACFVLLMLPALGPHFLRYLAHRRIRRHAYGPSLRHRLDVYAPEPRDGRPHPVVIFVSGGAWLIGYKMWAFLQAMVLQDNGVLVVSPDYRNFPHAGIDGMASDVDAAIAWALANLRGLRGDPANVTLVGQSAGAHLVALVLALHAAREGEEAAHGPRAPPLEPLGAPPLEGERGQRGWRLAQLRCWVGVSGPYCLLSLVETLHASGLDRRLLRHLFTDARRMSPSVRIEQLLADGCAALAQVPCLLVHGTADASVPWEHTTELAALLRAAGVRVQVELLEGQTHTDPILEGPVSGDDVLVRRLLALLRAQRARALCGNGSSCGRRGAGAEACRHAGPEGGRAASGGGCECDGGREVYPARRLPLAVLSLARRVNPF